MVASDLSPAVLTCPLCEAMCGLRMTVHDGRVSDIRGDPEDPLSRGAICPKAVALRDLHEDRNRLRYPLRRTKDGRHERVSWEEALEAIAEALASVRKTHGPDAVATYFGNPTVHNAGALLAGTPFAKALGTKNQFSATSLDQLPHMLAAWSMFGHQLLLPVPDLDRTRFVLVIGANPAVSNGSMMSAPGVKARLRELRRRGGRLVVVDPRKTETARLADEHLFIRPGTDALWLFALVRTVFEEIGPNLGHLEAHTKNLDRARSLAEPFTPEGTAEATGISPDKTRHIAERLLRTSEAVVYGRLGLCTQAFGGLCGWLLNLLNLVSGHLDKVGGAMFTTPAIDTLRLASILGRSGSFGRSHTSVRGLPEFSGELPTAALAEEMDREGPERIRALVTAAGNPVLSAPNGRRLDMALEKLDFMVSIDLYLNETTRHANFVLPPSSPLERDHYDLVFHTLAVRNTSKFSPALLEPDATSKDDFDILLELTAKLERKTRSPWSARLQTRLLRALGLRRILDLGLRLGPHRVSLRQLLESPSGLDHGPLQEGRLPSRLYTKDGTIDAAPALFAGDVPRLQAGLNTSAQPETLWLIGRRELRSNNSWMHNSHSLIKGPGRCTLRIHPDDAHARGISNGASVKLSSDVGSVRVQAECSDEMMPGVVSLPHGYGHGRDGTRLAVASQKPGVSANDVTDDRLVDALTGNAAFNGQPVQVETA